MTLLKIGKLKPSQFSISDWRWALAQACRPDDGTPGPKALEIVKKMLTEFIRRGAKGPSFNPATYTKCARQIATETLMGITDAGAYLVPPHSEMLYDGKKTAIVKAKKFDWLSDEFNWLLAGKLAYGLIRFKAPKEISLAEFESLRKKHKITEDEREEWWPKAEKLYYYEVRDFFRFDSPIKVKVPQGVQTRLRNVKRYLDSASSSTDEGDDLYDFDLPLEKDFFSELEVLVEDGEWLMAQSVREAPIDIDALTHGLKEISRLELIARHAKIHEIAESFVRRDKIVPEDVKNAHALIAAEMRKRGMEHRIETIVDQDSSRFRSSPGVSIRALGTRGNVEEWNEKHKKFTGVEIDVNGKKLLLDCGDKDFLKIDPAFVLLSHFHRDHFAWYDVKAAKTQERKEPGVLELQRSPSTIGASKMYIFISKIKLPEHTTYVEPFAGTARFLFHKEPSQKEVLNDLNEDGIFVLRFVKEMTNAEYEWLIRQDWKFNAEKRKKFIQQWRAKKFKSKAERFYITKYLMRTSMVWRDGGPSGPRYTANEKFDGKELLGGKERLKNVVILKGDYKQVIDKYDSPGTLFILDPPYRRTPSAWYKHNETGMDWEEFYAKLKSIKGKWLCLQSDGKEDRAILKKLGVGFKIARFPTKSIFGKEHQASEKRRKFICATNFPLEMTSSKTKKLDADEEELSFILEDPEEELQQIPDDFFVAAPRSKNDVSGKAEKLGFNLEWADSYEWGPFKCKAYPIDHSRLAPTVAWKIQAAGKTILYMPDVKDFDPDILKGVDIYIGDGASFTRDIAHTKKIGHMNIGHQVERAKKAGIPKILFVHCGKEIIENPELEKKIADLGAEILADSGKLDFAVDLIHLEDVLTALPDFDVQDKYFIVGSTAVSGRGYDLDILERGEIDAAARFRICTYLKHISERISFLNSSEGPFTSFVPLYRKGYRRFETKQIVMEAEQESGFSDLVLAGPAAKDAAASRREDKIVPGRFFALQKTHAGYHKREVFAVKDALEMVREAKFPYVGEEKKDGFHIEIHWNGANLILYSEDGKPQAVTTQAPELTKAFDKLPAFIGVAELEAWIPKDAAVKAGIVPPERPARDGKVHVGRGDVTGYMHSKTYNPLFAKNLLLNVYDVLWTKDDPELYKKPLSERMKVRDRILPKTGQVVAIDSELLKTPQDIVNFWKKTIKLPSSEGILLKPSEDRYVLWHAGGLWIKIKSLYETSVQILAAYRAKTKTGKPLNVWNAACAIRHDGKLVYIGTTYNAPIKMKPGDIIEVRFQNLSKYTDPKTGELWYNWWRPSVVSKRPEKKQPDSSEIAERLVRATDGEIGEKSLPRKAKEALGKLELSDLSRFEAELYLADALAELDLASDDLVEIEKEPPMPPEWERRIKKAQSYTRERLAKINAATLPKWFYVIQSHHRGKSLHLDFRQKQNEHLEGDTWLAQIAGVPDEPITTIAQAREMSRKFHGARASEFIKIYKGMDITKGWMIGGKERQPLGWINRVKDIIPKGEVGSTKEFPGVFFGEDWGIAITTVKKPWFEERYIYSKWFGTIRYIKRLLPTRPAYKKVGKKGVFWRAHFSDPKSPPYIFSPAFYRNTEWIPEDSALPPNWEAIIPEKLRWWGKGLPPKERLNLIKAAFNWLVEENFLKGRKKSLDKDDFSSILTDESYKGVLHRIWWRGPAHVRYMPISVWRLRIATPQGMLTFEFEKDPTRESRIGYAALRSISSTKPPKGDSPTDWLKFEGVLPAKHPENPNKRIEAHAVIEDSFTFRKVADSEDFLSGHFAGKVLKGYFILKREEPGQKIWLFKRSTKEIAHV